MSAPKRSRPKRPQVPAFEATSTQWERYLTTALQQEPALGPIYWGPIHARQLNAIMALLEDISKRIGRPR